MSLPLPHEAYRFPCPGRHCRNLSAVEGSSCCERCRVAHHAVRPRALRPHGVGGHEQPCAHAAQCRRGEMPGYVQIGDEVRCPHCRAWHPVVLRGTDCVAYCGTVVTAVGDVGAPYLAIMARRRPAARRPSS